MKKRSVKLMKDHGVQFPEQKEFYSWKNKKNGELSQHSVSPSREKIIYKNVSDDKYYSADFKPDPLNMDDNQFEDKNPKLIPTPFYDWGYHENQCFWISDNFYCNTETGKGEWEIRRIKDNSVVFNMEDYSPHPIHAGRRDGPYKNMHHPFLFSHNNRIYENTVEAQFHCSGYGA